MALLKFTFLLLNFLFAAYGFGPIRLSNPLQPNVKFESVEVCEPVDSPIAFEAHLDLIRGDDKAFSCALSLPVEINDETTFSAVADKWTDDEWFLNFYSVDGLVCEFFKKYLTKLWPQVAGATSPEMPNDCPLPPGNYSIENFEANKDDMTFPSYLPGLWRVTARVFDNVLENFLCVIVTVDIS